MYSAEITAAAAAEGEKGAFVVKVARRGEGLAWKWVGETESLTNMTQILSWTVTHSDSEGFFC